MQHNQVGFMVGSQRLVQHMQINATYHLGGQASVARRAAWRHQGLRCGAAGDLFQLGDSVTLCPAVPRSRAHTANLPAAWRTLRDGPSAHRGFCLALERCWPLTLGWR